MKTSPIKLNSSQKAKQRVTKSPSKKFQESQLICDGKIDFSVHTIPTKQNLNMRRDFNSSFAEYSGRYTNNQSYNNSVLRSGSPVSRNLSDVRDFSSQTKLRESKSFSNSVSTEFTPHSKMIKSPMQQNLDNSILNNLSISHIASPVKPPLDNERSFVRILELGKKIPMKSVDNLTSTARLVSPDKVIPQIHYQASPKQMELQRKVKILEGRVGQLNVQKNQIQTQMNEINIRLQYQNNFLKEKLDSYALKSNVLAQPVTCNARKVTLKAQKQLISICLSCQAPTSTLPESASQKPIKQPQVQQQIQSHQSKQIHALNKQLLQTQDMLNQQINKSLGLLEELADKMNQNESSKRQIERLKQKLDVIQRQFGEVTEKNQILENEAGDLQELKQGLAELQSQRNNLYQQMTTLQEQNQNLLELIQMLKVKADQMKIVQDALGDLEQNNQLLNSSITGLQASLNQSLKQISDLNGQKSQLQMRISQLQSQFQDSSKQPRQEQAEQSQMQILTAKMADVEAQLIARETQIQNLTQSLNQKQRRLQQKQAIVQVQQSKSEYLIKFQQQETANSFYNKSQSKEPCSKCAELRKTIFKLNSHLNHIS